MQPDLLDYALTPKGPTKRRPTVRQTSKLAVTVKRDSGTLQARAADIAHWLAWHWNATQAHPTTVELAVWIAFKGRQDGPETAIGRFARLDATAQRNYIARGMWDAQQAAMVEAVPDGDRKCAVNGRKACVWRLRSL